MYKKYSSLEKFQESYEQNSFRIIIDRKSLLPKKVRSSRVLYNEKGPTVKSYIFTYDKIIPNANYKDAVWSYDEYLKKRKNDVAEQSVIFGKTTELPFVLKGDIYYNDGEIAGLRYSEKSRKYAGTIYTTKLNVPNTDFSKGFPGVTNRFEHFEIDYNGTFMIRDSGLYYFRLTSDDGSILYIDDNTVINNDGAHGIFAKWGKVALDKGMHKIRVRYYQAPRPWVALMLDVSLDDLNYKTFDMKEFSTAQVEEKKDEVNVEISNEVLFDFDSYALKNEAKTVLKEMKAYYLDKGKYQKAVIIGHTDDKGEEEYNLKLSLKRAGSVKDWLVSQGIKPDMIKVEGAGESKPKYPNDTEENRAKNRRIEIIFQR